MAYQSKHRGGTIDRQIDRVIDGSVVVENTASDVTPSGINPVSGAGISTAIEAAKTDLKNRGYIFMGVATPATVAKVSGKCFYLAAKAGDYDSFGMVLPTDALTAFYWVGERWIAERIVDLVTPAEVEQICKNKESVTLVGNDSTVVAADFSYNLLAGHTIRCWLSRPDIDTQGISYSAKGYVRFSITQMDANNNELETSAYSGFDEKGALSSYYDFVLHPEVALLRVKMRAVKGFEQKIVVEDITGIESIIADSAYSYIPLTVSGMWSAIPFGAFTSTSNAMSTAVNPTARVNRIKARCYMGTSGSVITFFDATKNVLQDICVAGKSSKWTYVDIDLMQPEYADVKYFAVSHYGAVQGYEAFYCYAFKQESIGESIDSLAVASPFGTKNKLNILIFGDSQLDCTTISEADDATTAYTLNEQNVQVEGRYYSMWPVLMSRYINMADMRCYAKAGASYKTEAREVGLERRNLEHQITLAINDSTNPNGVFPTVGDYIPDVIIFSLGVNDQAPNDTFDSAIAKTIFDADGNFDIEATLANLDMSKFCEAARASFMRIRQKWPSSLVICTLPAQLAVRDQATEGVNLELRKMAERYSMIVVDLAAELGVVRDFEKDGALGALLKDGLHYNDIAQSLCARLIVSRIKDNFINMRWTNASAIDKF